MKDAVILLAEDDDGHAVLTRTALRQLGIENPIVRFRDGQEVVDFFFGAGPLRVADVPYLLLLDLRMPRVDGVAVLRRIRQDGPLRRMPVVVLSTTEDPNEIETCKSLHCSCYIVKPAGYEAFAEALHQLKPLLECRRA